jgi:hypothetical protein
VASLGKYEDDMYDDEDHRDIETTQYHMEQVASHRNDETVVGVSNYPTR